MNPVAVGFLVAGAALLPWSLATGAYTGVTLLGVLCIILSLAVQSMWPGVRRGR